MNITHQRGDYGHRTRLKATVQGVNFSKHVFKGLTSEEINKYLGGWVMFFGMCEKCWNDASLRVGSDSSKSQYDHYLDLMDERRETPCTPEQQEKA